MSGKARGGRHKKFWKKESIIYSDLERVVKMELEYIKPDVMKINISLNISEANEIQHALAEVNGIDDELRMFFLNLVLKAHDLWLNKEY